MCRKFKINIPLLILISNFFSFFSLVISCSAFFLTYSKLSTNKGQEENLVFGIKENSNKEQLSLLKHLNEIGAILYCSDWCEYTLRQKNSFEIQAEKNKLY